MHFDRILATIRVIESNTHARHVNMTGENFIANHQYFDKILDTIRGMIDYVAEASRRTDEIPVHTLSGFIELSAVPEEPVIKSMDEMLIDESIELKTLVALVYGGIEQKKYNPSVESKLTDFTDELEAHCYWIDSTTKLWAKPLQINE